MDYSPSANAFQRHLHAGKLAKYFDRTYDIPLKERDDHYLSPVLFWIILGPLSLILMFMWQDQRALALYGANLNQRIATAILMMLGPPLGFALASVLVRRESITRRSLGRQFALQCYFHGPMTFLFATVMPFAMRHEDTVLGNALLTLVLLGWIALLITEFRVAQRESEVGRAAASAALGCGFAMVLFFLIGLAVGLVLFLSGRPIFSR